MPDQDYDRVNRRLQLDNGTNKPGHELIRFLHGINANMEAIQHKLESDQILVEEYSYEPTIGTITLQARAKFPWKLTDLLATWSYSAVGSSQYAEGSVTSPGAGATIASIAAANLPAGTYQVNVVANLAGTLTQGTDNNNLELVGSGTDILPNEITAGDQNFGPFNITLNGSQALTLKTIAAGTSGSIYSGSITATLLTQSPTSAIVTVKDRTFIGLPSQGSLNLMGASNPMMLDIYDKITLTVTPAVACSLWLAGSSDYRKIERLGNE